MSLFPRNEIVYKDEIPQNEPYMYETGRSIGLNYGYVFDRFFEAKDFNEDGSTITESLRSREHLNRVIFCSKT